MMTKSSTSSYGLISSECYDLSYGSMSGILTLQLCKAPRPWRTSPASGPEPGWDLHLVLLNASVRGGLIPALNPQALPLVNLWVRRFTGWFSLSYCAPFTSLIYHMALEVTRALVYLTTLNIPPMFFSFYLAHSSLGCNQFLVPNP